MDFRWSRTFWGRLKRANYHIVLEPKKLEAIKKLTVKGGSNPILAPGVSSPEGKREAVTTAVRYKYRFSLMANCSRTAAISGSKEGGCYGYFKTPQPVGGLDHGPLPVVLLHISGVGRNGGFDLFQPRGPWNAGR
jgi:hypothetical protein